MAGDPPGTAAAEGAELTFADLADVAGDALETDGSVGDAKPERTSKALVQKTKREQKRVDKDQEKGEKAARKNKHSMGEIGLSDGPGEG